MASTRLGDELCEFLTNLAGKVSDGDKGKEKARLDHAATLGNITGDKTAPP